MELGLMIGPPEPVEMDRAELGLATVRALQESGPENEFVGLGWRFTPSWI